MLWNHSVYWRIIYFEANWLVRLAKLSLNRKSSKRHSRGRMTNNCFKRRRVRRRKMNQARTLKKLSPFFWIWRLTSNQCSKTSSKIRNWSKTKANWRFQQTIPNEKETNLQISHMSKTWNLHSWHLGRHVLRRPKWHRSLWQGHELNSFNNWQYRRKPMRHELDSRILRWLQDSW